VHALGSYGLVVHNHRVVVLNADFAIHLHDIGIIKQARVVDADFPCFNRTLVVHVKPVVQFQFACGNDLCACGNIIVVVLL
jgi:hypothetical protein